MFRRSSWTWWVALACALAVGGCSGAPTSRSAPGPGNDLAGGVRLSPSPAYAASRLDVIFDDPRIDPAACQFRWRRDDVVIEGARGPTLDASYVTRGHRISVDVWFVDPSTGQPRALRAQVPVENTPPRVASVVLTLAPASGGIEIRANVESADSDGDHVSHEIHWFKNGAPMVGAGGQTVPAAGLSHDDRVWIEVVANDGHSSSPPFRSPVLEIDNQPPRFSSQPVAPRARDVVFRYQATAVDPDGDRLHYELVKAPAGMIIEPRGMVIWPLPPLAERVGEHVVAIKAIDANGGETVQEFTIRFDTATAKP